MLNENKSLLNERNRAQVKRTFQNNEARLKKFQELEQKYLTEKAILEGFESGIIAMTGYKSHELVRRVMIPRVEKGNDGKPVIDENGQTIPILDKNGKQMFTRSYEMIYPKEQNYLPVAEDDAIAPIE